MLSKQALIRAVIYVRFSSDKQHDSSIEAQLWACRSYAQRKGYIVVQEYTDRAESGRYDDRPEYQRMLADAKKRSFEVVIFHKVDRNARNEYDYYHHKRQLQKDGVRIEYSEQQFDNTPEGKMMENVVVGFAAYYSRNLARETMKVLTMKASRSEFCGGVPPFGYAVEGKNYVVNEQEAIAVKTIFDMFLQGVGYSAICDWLTAHGYKTRRGCYFGKNSLHDILKNEKYAGIYVYGKVQRDFEGKRTNCTDVDKIQRQENSIPAIIDNTTFGSVQSIMDKRKSSGRQYHDNTTKFVLTGLVTCGSCGCKMIGTKVKNGQYLYYRCNKKERHADAGKCVTPMIPKQAIEEVVIDEIWDRLLNPESYPVLIDSINRQIDEKKESNAALITKLGAEEKTLMAKLNGFYDVIGTTGKPLDEFDQQCMQETKDRIRAIRQQLTTVCTQDDLITIPEYVVKEVIEDWSLAIKEKNLDKIQAMLQNVVSKVVVSSDYKVSITLKLVCLELVPRTGIEPVRKFLSDGF